MSKLSRMLANGCLAVAMVTAAAAARAEPAWPDEKPITWVVGFSAGGSVDVITRAVAQQVSATLKQNVVVENKAGAAGAIALASVARAKPDGYTLITVPGPILREDDGLEIGEKLVGVATLAEGAVVMVGAANGPADFKQLRAAIEKTPNAFTYASSGVGTGQHIAGAMFNLALQAQMVHVPYKGGSQALANVMGGQVTLGFLGVSTVLPQVLDGKLIAYAVTSPNRVASLPDVPTFEEAGIAGFNLTQWYVAAMPAGTPEAVIQKFRRAVDDALRTPQILTLLKASGLDAPGKEAQDPTAFARASIEQSRMIAKKANITLQ
ncbi:Bug family tripartite tricarboxylate transporter substrate binding protein [Bordetella genomosp. 11]|uniref:Bug family tripartite tricarboxylate transporter substrate binding protein n=1 Tax=Bordetella genomosp. 11 TaxID=1416808 RepID=UPI001594E7C8|nr:tripartite tricarboxylate transporter substrate binding protein [Bordetella genomosp. 11]